MFVNEAGYEHAQAVVSAFSNLPGFKAMDAGLDALPDSAKATVARLASHLGRVDDDTLLAEYDALSNALPLEASAELNQFLQKHGFIE